MSPYLGGKMRLRWIAPALILVSWMCGSASLGAPAPRSEGNPETLTLDKAVKRALSYNRTIQIARITLRTAEIAYRNAWDTMFAPGASLTLSTNSNYSVGQLPGGPGLSGYDHGFPASGVQLTLGSYTLFNFWRDWIVYQQAELDWRRSQEVYNEAVRAVRFQVISAFFKLESEQEKVESSKRSVGIAEAIVELVQSKVRLGKATETDVSSSQVDYNNAKNDYFGRQISQRSALWVLNQLLGDPVDTQYNTQEPLRYAALTLTTSQALRIYWEQSPDVKNGKKDLKKAELAVDLAEKNRIPVPKITFSGVTLSYQNAYYGMTASPYGPSQGNVNVDVSAQLNMTLPLYGPGGFLNSRVVEQSELSRDQTDLTFQDTTNRDVAQLYQLIITIKRDEDLIKNNKQSFEKSTSVLDGLFSKLSTGAVSRLELRDALQAARDSELNLLDAQISHLSDKLTLAQLIGIDHLPGDWY